MAELKSVSLRLPIDLVERLTKKNESFTQTVINELNTLERIRKVSLLEVRALFTEGEWKFMAETFHSVILQDIFCANTNAFIAACQDAELYDKIASKHGVKLEHLILKIKQLKGANIEAIYNRIVTFWDNADSLDFDDWANF